MSTQEQKAKPKPLTVAGWQKYGRALTTADIEALAASRSGKTATFATFERLGARVVNYQPLGSCLAFPLFPADGDGASLYAVKLRALGAKDFSQEHAVCTKGFFNLPAVNPLEDVYVVEGEPDVAILEEAGFRAVSVTSGAQRKFKAEALEALSGAARIFLVGDMRDKFRPDDPGAGCIDALQASLSLVCPEKVFRIQFTDAHDMCDLAKRTGDGFAERVNDLSEESLVPWVLRGKSIPKIHELSKEPEKWIVNKLLPERGLALLCGSMGSTKSILALAVAQAIAGNHNEILGRELWTGVKVFSASWTNLPSKDGNYEPAFAETALRFKAHPSVTVLYIDRENPEAAINKRCSQLGISGNHDFRYWGQFNKDNPPPEPDDRRLLDLAKRSYTYFIFDSLQQWYGAASEIDNTAMGELMRKFQNLARTSAGVLLLHHNRKDSEGMTTTYRGGSAIASIPDMSIAIEKEDAGLTAHCTLKEIRFRMCEPWVLKYDTTWHAATKHFTDGSITLTKVSDNSAAEQSRIEKKKKDDLSRVIDDAISANQNLSKKELIDAARKALPDDNRLAGSTESGINKLTRITDKLGWEYNKDRAPKWAKEQDEPQKSQPLAFADDSGQESL